MKNFIPFTMERMMSKLEHEVDFNLSESGVHPMLLEELLGEDRANLEELLATDLNYPHANGTPGLRRNISALYEGAAPENVLVTVGAIEANYLAITTLLDPGDELAVMAPNYMQIWGVAQNSGVKVRTFGLKENEGWTLDTEELEAAVSPATKMIAVCNPNNPTGRILDDEEMNAIVRSAESVGAWILADEVYAGAERERERETQSFFGLYDKVLAIGSMSKAYGLPGLRTGWAVGDEAVIDEMWARHEYLAISTAMLSNKLTELALSEEVRPRIIARTREYIRSGFPVFENWMAEQEGLFNYTAPDAAAIAFVRYNLDINSTEFVERLVREKSVLIVPGDHFGIDNHIRVSYGLPHAYLRDALGRIRELFDEVRAEKAESKGASTA
ncbi:MAG: aminotransferase class I/II-fold pyridoxal phosphate-dependent enzyme [Pyrinomonadaceae bacterium]